MAANNNREPNSVQIIMIGTSLSTMGGISAVVNVYKDAGLFRRWGIRYLASHTDGSALKKITWAMRAFGNFFFLLLFGNPRLVHIHSASHASFWRKTPFVLLARAFRVPCVFHLHGGGFLTFCYSECGRIRRWIIFRVLRLASDVIVLTEAWRRSLLQILPPERISVIANPVECRGEDAASTRGKKYDVLYLGGFFENKGVHVLLSAISGLRAHFPEIRICCAGGGDLEKFALARSKYELDDSIEILGWVDKQVRDNLLSSSAIFVLPSFAEGLPMSMLEAMASGLPVVVSAVGGIPDVIESGKHGILTDPGDVEGLRMALEALLTDEDLRLRMGSAGRVKVLEAFSVDVVIPQVTELYRKYNAAALDAQ